MKGATKNISSQEGGFLNILRPLRSAGLLLMKSVLAPLAKSSLVPLGLTAAASAANAGFQKKTFPNEDTDDMKTVKPLEESNLLIRDVSETIKNEAKEQKGGFLSMLLGTLALSLLGSALAGKGVMRGGEGVIRAGKGTIRAGQSF